MFFEGLTVCYKLQSLFFTFNPLYYLTLILVIALFITLYCYPVFMAKYTLNFRL